MAGAVGFQIGRIASCAKDLYVTVGLFTMDVCILRFRKMQSPAFKRSITASR